MLYFIRCQTTSGVPNIVGWPTARSKLSVKSVGLQVLAFPKSWRSISLNTDGYLHTACFVLWIIRLLIKFQIRLLALGFEPRHTSRCLHIITWGCSANWTILTCQNLSFLIKVCKIWNETLSQLVSFSLLNRFALKKGPPLYVKFVILPIS